MQSRNWVSQCQSVLHQPNGMGGLYSCTGSNAGLTRSPTTVMAWLMCVMFLLCSSNHGTTWRWSMYEWPPARSITFRFSLQNYNLQEPWPTKPAKATQDMIPTHPIKRIIQDFKDFHRWENDLSWPDCESRLNLGISGLLQFVDKLNIGQQIK